MRFEFTVPQAESPRIVIEYPFMLRPRVSVDGKRIERVRDVGRPYLIEMPDGTAKKMTVSTAGLDYVPKVTVDGERIYLARKLSWYELLLGAFPVLLLFLGGAIGGLIGGGAMILNYRVLRTERPAAVKALIVLGTTVSASILMLLASLAFTLLLHGLR